MNALVPPRATLAAVLEAHELLAQEVAAIVGTLGQTFDLRRFRAGQPYRLDRFHDGRLREFEYEIDLDRRAIVRRRGAGGDAAFEAEIAVIPKTVDAIVVEGAISRAAPSLVQAIDAAGERIELSLALADVFSGEMDFNSDLQPGDTFRILVERGTRDDGRFAGYGAVLAAEYVNAGRALRAVRFTPPDGKPGYYDLEGRSLKRFFLKSPLRFEPRITSSFSRSRRHPILNYTRAHNGVDYAAPGGRPWCRWEAARLRSPDGRPAAGTVRVRHASGYESRHCTCRRLARASAGTRVGQGEELIGVEGRPALPPVRTSITA